MGYRKVYVETLVRFSTEGGMFPVELRWGDGMRYAVDRVKSFGRAPAHVSSILPVRYTCLFGGRERNLYYEPDEMRWFVEVAV